MESEFLSALSYSDYVDLLGENLALYKLHYRKFEIPPIRMHEIEKMPQYNILVITEPWCGDSLALLPVLRKLSETAGKWQIKVVLREREPQLMDRFMSNGSRAIPVFLFLNESYELVFTWGPRPLAARRIFENNRSAINAGKVIKEHVLRQIRTFYAGDRGRSTMQEILLLLKKFEDQPVPGK